MKLTQFINQLKEVKKKHGNIKVIYSSDDEGNAYHQIYFAPTPIEVKKFMDYMSDEDFDRESENINAVIIN